MSKLLAMMMKPKNYMYATIKGSLTENDGVFSGFSASDYLALQQPFVLNADTVAEINTKIKLTTQHLGAIIGTYNYYGFTLLITGENLIQVGYGQGGGSWVNLITGTTTLSLNTDYFIKVLINKKNITILYSLDNVNWITEISNTLTITTTQNLILDYGMGRTSSAYFRGSIDLNQSYIKINNTKYQLQAVVGYTVVGTPTITDGVVSGFSSSNYLKITQSVSLGSNFEIKTKVVTGSDVTSQRVIFSGLTGQYINFSIQNGKTQQNIGNGTSWEITQTSQTFGKTTIATNTTYYLRFTFNGSAYRLYLSTDNINWILDWKYESVNVIPSCQYVWGVSRSLSGVFNGSIDIANSYIKQNNKLWFNGQPA